MTSTRLRFTKMHGAGNDFIVLNGIDQDLSGITKDEWRQLAHRQFGIGADQILLIEKAMSHYVRINPRSEKTIVEGVNITGLKGPKILQFVQFYFLIFCSLQKSYVIRQWCVEEVRKYL